MFRMMEYHLKVQWSSVIQKMPERSQYLYCTFWAHYEEVSWHIIHMIFRKLAKKKAIFRYLRGSAIWFQSDARMAQLTAWVPSGLGTQAGITVGSRSPTGPSWATRREKLLIFGTYEEVPFALIQRSYGPIDSLSTKWAGYSSWNNRWISIPNWALESDPARKKVTFWLILQRINRAQSSK